MKCRNTLNAMTDESFPYFEVLPPSLNNGKDELFEALNFSSSDHSKFDNSNPTNWDDVKEQMNFKYDPLLADSTHQTQIGNKLSNDLDLFWMEDDEKSMFRYQGNYIQLCQDALEYIKEEDNDKKKALVTEIMQIPEFNYLSENPNVRLRLYQMCKLSDQIKMSDQEILFNNFKVFEQIFN